MPGTRQRVRDLLNRGKSLLSGGESASESEAPSAKFRGERDVTRLFQVTDPKIDGDECLHDCATCTVCLPSSFKIDESDNLYGYVKGWSTHLVVATGKSDWVRDVADEKGSIMEAVGKYGQYLENGRVMLSASNMPTPNGEVHGQDNETTRVLLLPTWKIIDDLEPDMVPRFMEKIVARSVTNTTRVEIPERDELREAANGAPPPPSTEETEDLEHLTRRLSLTRSRSSRSISGFTMTQCPHRAIILLCSQKTRDARCGQSAPLLRKEFERHLRPLGLYRDLQDERPGGVGIYFISHVGGHKYSANVMVYRREGRRQDGTDEDIDGAPLSSEAVQCIWLARVRPEDCENIIRFTVLQGKVVKPQRQLRGGFDRERGLVSW